MHNCLCLFVHLFWSWCARSFAAQQFVNVLVLVIPLPRWKRSTKTGLMTAMTMTLAAGGVSFGGVRLGMPDSSKQELRGWRRRKKILVVVAGTVWWLVTLEPGPDSRATGWRPAKLPRFCHALPGTRPLQAALGADGPWTWP